MRLTVARMGGLKFGELAKSCPGGKGIRGITYFYLSPFEQKAFPPLKQAIPNTIRRFAENFWRVVPPFVAAYFIYDYYEKLAEKMMRKNPDDYKCDQ